MSNFKVEIELIRGSDEFWEEVDKLDDITKIENCNRLKNSLKEV